MALSINYCTRCDKDISSSTGSVCPQCQSTTHSIAISISEKCDNCGGTWIGHGNLASGSACRNMAGFFTPNAASPTMPQGYMFRSGQASPTPGLAARVDAIMTSATDAAHRMANKSNGAKCSKCGDFNEYAIGNQPDGSFTCYSCKH
jgi:hypothetical protein